MDKRSTTGLQRDGPQAQALNVDFINNIKKLKQHYNSSASRAPLSRHFPYSNEYHYSLLLKTTHVIIALILKKVSYYQ